MTQSLVILPITLLLVVVVMIHFTVVTAVTIFMVAREMITFTVVMEMTNYLGETGQIGRIFRLI